MEHIDIGIRILGDTMLFGIITSFFLATYWETFYMIKTKDYKFVKIFRSIATFIMIFVYGSMLVGDFANFHTVNESLFADIIVRPSLFFLGCSLAASSRFRCNFITKKGIQ